MTPDPKAIARGLSEEGRLITAYVQALKDELLVYQHLSGDHLAEKGGEND